MMETRTLGPGITLRTFRDSRFKQGCLSFQLLRQMDKQEAAMNALLPSVLLRGTKGCPDLRAITDRLDTLYGASVGAQVRRVGDYQTTGLYCGFMDDRFALPGDQVLAPMIGFLEELLLDSPVEAGGFLPGLVESEKKNLIATLDAQRNDKRSYAMSQLLKAMCDGDSFGLPRLGEQADVAAITPQGLYRHYQTILKTSPIELFYVGSADGDQVARLLKHLFSRIPREAAELPPQTALRPGEKKDLTETMEVSQGKLCMGFTTPITNRCGDFAAMQMVNTIYGGGMISKLFQKVREELSLCYSISSGYYGTKGIMTVAAGIDFDKEALVREEVLRQLRACQEGDISQEELTAAREALISSLRSAHDSPGAIEGYYSTAVLGGTNLSIGDYIRAVERVEKADVVRAARTLSLHSTYFLKGESQ